MIIIIKLVDRCPEDFSGEFRVLSNGRCRILISKRKNKDLTEFADTLLHELLHFWVTLLQTYGVKESIRREHKFIDEAVPDVLLKFAKHFK
jgi:hypothetical protein